MAQSTLPKPKTSTKAKSKSAARWLCQQLKQAGLADGFKLKTQQRGNTLHVLLESQPCPDMLAVLDALSLALESSALPVTASPIYRLLIYGRAKGDRQPRWKKPVDLGQLDRVQYWVHEQRQQRAAVQRAAAAAGLEESEFAQIEDAANAAAEATGEAQTAALIVSSRAQAKTGDPEAIAHYLSESLSSLGISVRVAVKAATEETSLMAKQRLWVLCESNYSLDAAVTAERVVMQLRSLDLEGFQDAAIFSQVRGEVRPDWALRIDLTPKQELLRQWARWGDEEAIVRLLNPVLLQLNCIVTAQAQNKSLQLFCRSIAEPPQPLDAGLIKTAIAPLLEDLAPQGIHAATIYGLHDHSDEQLPQNGPQNGPSSPSKHQWVEWLTLPAAAHTDLSAPTLELAEQGDLDAAMFLLNRILNPDIDQRLQTGGIRIQMMRKGDLLHVMCDAPICPRRKKIGRPAVKYVRQLRLPKVSGVRIYGRRSGQVKPRWQYGRDFVPRQQDAVDVVPQFERATAPDESLLVTHPGEISAGDIGSEGLNAEVAPWEGMPQLRLPLRPVGKVLQTTAESLQRGLLKSQLFVRKDSPWEAIAAAVPASERYPSPETPAAQTPLPRRRVALIWASLGLLAAGSTDLILGHNLRRLQASPAAVDLAVAPNALGDRLLGKGALSNGSGSNVSNLGRGAESFVKPQASSEQMAEIAALQRDYPDFNNALFDEKLALYRQRVMTEGAPDVLIVGSSRALRGIDPGILASGLSEVGYPDLSIFNFSINGSTARVVELQLSLLLESQYKPGIIIWADGARAFNSGRQDATFQAIEDSPAYRRLTQGILPPLFGGDSALQLADGRQGPNLSQLTQIFSVKNFDSWLDNHVGRLSSAHGQRDRIQAHLKNRFAQGVTDLQRSTGLKPFDHTALVPDAPEGEGLIDFDGFMPLSIRFNPATYYQRYSRVSGQYDGDYQRFRLQGIQQKSLDSVVQLTQAQQIPLVFVNLPLTTDYLDPVRSRYERVFQKDMFQRMTQRQLTFRDLTQLWPTEVGNFSDPSHLNRYGARQVSTHLSEDPLIPWPQVIRN